MLGDELPKSVRADAPFADLTSVKAVPKGSHAERVRGRSEEETLITLMRHNFGDCYNPKQAKTIRNELCEEEVLGPRFNRRGTEFMMVASGRASINGGVFETGDLVRIDTGELTQITALSDCELISHVWPHRKVTTHQAYSPPRISPLLQRFNNSLVSVVIIAKDIEHHICHAIIACLNQTYSHLQIIVVDDDSEDSTAAKAASLASHDDRVEVYSIVRGMNGARRFGIEKAKGKYCLIIDGDDWLNDDAVEKLLETAFECSSECVLYGFDHYNDKTGEVWNPVFPAFNHLKNITLPVPVNDKEAKEISAINHTVWMNFFSLNLKDIALRSLIHIYQYEDVPFSLTLMQYAKNPAICNNILYHYRRERTGQSTEKWWAVLPSQKQACLRASVSHALRMMKPSASAYHLMLLYKIDHIINHEYGVSPEEPAISGWRSLLVELFRMFPKELEERIVAPGTRHAFHIAHRGH